MLASTFVALTLAVAAAAQKCSDPIVSQPTSGYTFDVTKPTIQGSIPAFTSGFCNFFYLSVDGVSYGVQQANNDLTFSVQVPSKLENGDHSLTISSGGPPESRSDPVTVAFKVAATGPQCAPVQITSPTPNQDFVNAPVSVKGTVTVSGAQVRCNSVIIVIGTQTFYTGLQDDNTFEYDTGQVFPDGTNTVAVRTSDPSSDTTVDSPRATVTFQSENTAQCVTPPALYSPQAGTVGATVRISGQADLQGACSYVFVTITRQSDGQVIESGPSTDVDPVYGYFDYTPTSTFVNGQTYTISITTSADSSFRRQSDPLVRTITINTSPCSAPVLTLPNSNPYTYTTPLPDVQGTSDSGCDQITAIFARQDGTTTQTFGTQIQSGNTFDVTPYEYVQPGTYTLTVTANNDAGDRGSPATSPLTVIVDPPTCTNTPTIVAPTSGQTLRNGAVEVDASFTGQQGCTLLTFTAVPTAGGSTVSATNTVSPFDQQTSSTVLGLSAGEYTITTVISYPDGSRATSPSSVTITVNPGQCSKPTITEPRNGDKPTTTSIAVAGTQDNTYSDCLLITVVVDETYYATATASAPVKRADYNWVTSPFTLSLGQHTVRAFAGSGDSQSDNSNTVTFTIIDTATTGGTNGRKRRLVCQANEDLCSYVSPDNQLIQECIEDLASNIERCGSCGGPDCTALPHVDEVSCVLGECVVSSCRSDYELLDNRCEAAVPAFGLLDQALLGLGSVEMAIAH